MTDRVVEGLDVPMRTNLERIRSASRDAILRDLARVDSSSNGAYNSVAHASKLTCVG
jgi:hypothetical protein